MKRSDLTRPELLILKQLWALDELSAREIHQRVGDALNWSYSTTRTTLERMCAKGLLSKRSVHGMTVYAASVDKVATLGGLIRDFARQVLELDRPPPVAMFADSKLLSDEELESLEALLRREGEDE